MALKDFETVIRSDVLRELLQHWRDAKGSRRMPGWSDLNPALIKPVLPLIWSWKYDRADDRFTGRLVGDRIHKLYGASNAGRTLEDCFPKGYYAAIAPVFRRIVTTPEFLREHGPIYAHLGGACDGERIALPLAEDGEHADGIIGASYFVLEGPLIREGTTLTTTTEEWFALD